MGEAKTRSENASQSERECFLRESVTVKVLVYKQLLAVQLSVWLVQSETPIDLLIHQPDDDVANSKFIIETAVVSGIVASAYVRHPTNLRLQTTTVTFLSRDGFLPFPFSLSSREWDCKGGSRLLCFSFSFFRCQKAARKYYARFKSDYSKED